MPIKKVVIPIFLLLLAPALLAQSNLSDKLAGTILLQVEENGEAWYLEPESQTRYFLGRPSDAFSVMQELGLGISNENLEKISVGIIEYNDNDNDQDGLSNRLENALLLNPQNNDSDNDGFSDQEELINGHNPLGSGTLPIDQEFTKNNIGKIFLQVEQNGEAWYVNPSDHKRYFLGRPSDAFVLMKKLGLGISNQNIESITKGVIKTTEKPDTTPITRLVDGKSEHQEALDAAAQAIRDGNKEEAVKHFVPELRKRLEGTIDFFDQEGLFGLANTLSGSTLTKETDDEAVYENEKYFSLGGYKYPLKFIIKKQEDGNWLLTNL